MSGIKRLRRIQTFKEAAATKGTTGIATAVQRVTGTVDDQRVMHFPDEDIGYLVDVERVSNPYKFAVLEIEEHPATFEQIGYALCAGIKRLDTGTADGAGTGDVWTFPFSYKEPVNDFSTYAIEAGDNEEMEILPYSYLANFKLSGKPKLPVMISETYEARQAERLKLAIADAVFAHGPPETITPTVAGQFAGANNFPDGSMIRIEGSTGNDSTFTVVSCTDDVLTVTETIADHAAEACTIQQDFTDSAALPNVEDILFSKAVLSIDPDTGAFGAGTMTALLMGFDLDVQTGIQARPAASGELYFPRAALVNPVIRLGMTLEWNGDSSDEKQLWKDGGHAGRLIRIKIEGSALATAGAYTYKTLIIDLAGQYEKFEKLGEDNGNDIVDVMFRGQYNTTEAAYSTITLVADSLNALP